MDDKTIETLREALKFSPDNVPLRRHLAATLVAANRLEEARVELTTALGSDAADVATLLELGQVLLQLERGEEAAARFSDALRRDDKNASAHIAMSRALTMLKQREKAARHYQQAMDLDPTLSDAGFEKELFPPDADVEKPQPARSGPERESVEAWDTETNSVADLGLEMERPDLKFNDIGGMEALKEEIRVNIIYPFQNPEVYAAYGKKVGGGILLYGPPGCGKTYMARATAGECDARFMVVGIEDVLDMWIGQSERKLHLIFEAARQASPTVLFFDELDALAGKRSDMTHSPHARSVVNQLLAETDGAKGDNSELLIVGATNSPWHVDAAFRRPGRFDKILFVPPPDLVARVEILKIHCRKKPVENLDYEKIAARMKRFSGADIASACDAAAEIGLRETLKTGKLRKLVTNDFLAALKTIRPTTEEWLSTAKNYALYANQTGLYDPIAQYLQKGGD
jgi:transitional endoplasmic reticulum ATPase